MRLRAYWPQLVIVAAACAFCWPVFAGRIMSPADMLLLWLPWKHALASQFPDFHQPHNPMFDPIQQYLPWRIYATESLRAGLVPLWNPYQFMGTPFLANLQSTLLYPPNVLFLVTGAAHGFGVSAILHLILGGLGMFALLRSLALRPAAALLGALVFMFNGFTVTWMEYPTLSLWTLMWLPGILLAYERATRRPVSIWPALCALLLGVQFLGGHLQISSYIVMALGIYALVRAISQRRPALLALAVVPLVLGLALAAGQILPTLELAQHTGRVSHGLSGALKTAFPITHLVLYLVPNFFGNPVDYNYWGNFRDPSAFNYFETACYVGILPLVLAMWSLRRWREPSFWCFAALVVFAVLAAVGSPVYYLLHYAAPGFKELAGLGRVLCLAAFGLAGLAAMGMDSVLAEGKGLRLGWAVIVFTGGAIAGVCWQVFGPVMGELGWGYQMYMVRQATAFAALAFACMILIQLRCRLRLGASAFSVLAIGLVVADLFGFGMRFNPFVDARLAYPETESIRWLKEHAGHDRVTSLASAEGKIDWFPHNAAMVYGLRDIHGSDSLRVESSFGWASVGGNQAYYLDSGTASPWWIMERVMDRFAVRYLITERPLAGEWRLVHDSDARVYENTQALPRVQLYHKVDHYEGDIDHWLPLVPLDAVSLLSDHVAQARSEWYAASHQPISPGFAPSKTERIVFVRDEPQCIQLRAEGVRSGGVLALMDSLYPGWQARVDGRSVTIFDANRGFRGVYLPPGEHTVTFRYEPATYRVGLFVSLLALGMLLAFGVACFVSSRSSAAATAA